MMATEERWISGATRVLTYRPNGESMDVVLIGGQRLATAIGGVRDRYIGEDGGRCRREKAV